MRNWKIGILTLMGLATLAMSMAFFPGKAAKIKGSYYLDAGIFDRGKGLTCRPDSAAGTTIRIDQDHENPLFQSKLPNQVHLLLWFKQGIEAKRYELPSDEVEACYWEQGDLLMFHSFKAKGWIEFSAPPSNGKLNGKMEMKLVEPHHNMSNSDYHYMGGEFALKEAKL
jgi:hypothetical protein